MTKFYLQILIMSAVFMVSLKFGKCLKCYTCSELLGQECQGPFVGKPTVTCPDTYSCVKVNTGRHPKAITRGCEVKGHCTQVGKNCYECGKELCNASTSIMSSFAVITLLTLFTII